MAAGSIFIHWYILSPFDSPESVTHDIYPHFSALWQFMAVLLWTDDTSEHGQVVVSVCMCVCVYTCKCAKEALIKDPRVAELWKKVSEMLSSILSKRIHFLPEVQLLNDISASELCITQSHMWLAGLTAAEWLKPNRWKAPHSVNTQRWLLDFIDTANMEHWAANIEVPYLSSVSMGYRVRWEGWGGANVLMTSILHFCFALVFHEHLWVYLSALFVIPPVALPLYICSEHQLKMCQNKIISAFWVYGVFFLYIVFQMLL